MEPVLDVKERSAVLDRCRRDDFNGGVVRRQRDGGTPCYVANGRKRQRASDSDEIGDREEGGGPSAILPDSGVPN
jgi:hypothetical protein